MKTTPFLEKVLKKLEPLDSIKARAMFGGYGIYYKEVIFAIIVENELYFRVDEKNRKKFEKYQSHPFVYEGKNKPIEMPYMTLPDEVFNNRAQLKLYVENAYEASLRSKQKKVNKKVFTNTP